METHTDRSWGERGEEEGVKMKILNIPNPRIKKKAKETNIKQTNKTPHKSTKLGGCK